MLLFKSLQLIRSLSIFDDNDFFECDNEIEIVEAKAEEPEEAPKEEKKAPAKKSAPKKAAKKAPAKKKAE